MELQIILLVFVKRRVGEMCVLLQVSFFFKHLFWWSLSSYFTTIKLICIWNKCVSLAFPAKQLDWSSHIVRLLNFFTFSETLIARLWVSERLISLQLSFFAYFSPISGDHKAICDSWIGKDWKTLCLHIVQFVKRKVTLSRTQPSISHETCSKSLLLILWNIP